MQQQSHPVGHMMGLIDTILGHHQDDLTSDQQQQLSGFRQQLQQNPGYYQQNPDQMQNIFNGIIGAAAPFILNYGINAILNRGQQSGTIGGYMPSGGYAPSGGFGGVGGYGGAQDPLGGLISGALPGIIGGLTGGQGGLGGILGGLGGNQGGGVFGGDQGGGFQTQPPLRPNTGGETTV